MKIKCPLCETVSEPFEQTSTEYYICNNCSSIFMNPDNRPAPDAERARYLTHNNDVDDAGYRSFVTPIVNAIEQNFTKEHIGLDFGAGTGPVAFHLLKEKGYNINIYDPFFANDKSLLKIKYDYIICCEVIEHFYNPAKEFKLLKSLLKSQTSSGIFCMTKLISKEIDFKTWHYKNDITHVFFYSADTIQWIKEHFDFSGAVIEDRLIRLMF